MSSAIVENLDLTNALSPLSPMIDLGCEERKQHATPQPENWLSATILKSYLSSFHVCLESLGWVPKSILEIGCGNGSLLSYLAQTFMDTEVIGVDFDADTIVDAKEKNCCRVEFIQLNSGESLPYSCNQFDLVIAHGTLSQVNVPRSLLKEMARVSAEGVVLSVHHPTFFNLMKALPGAKKASLIGKPVFSQKARPISPAQLKQWIARAGLKIETALTPAPFHMVMARKPQII